MNSLLGQMVDISFIDPNFSKEIHNLFISGKVSYSKKYMEVGITIDPPDTRLELSQIINNCVICCEYENPPYKKSHSEILPNAHIPKRTLDYIDTKQYEKQRSGECFAIKLTQKLMGIDKEEPEFITSYVNLPNQPHQRIYSDGKNKGPSAVPIIITLG